jgi:chromosomal replication initiation ATPase DnaA
MMDLQEELHSMPAVQLDALRLAVAAELERRDACRKYAEGFLGSGSIAFIIADVAAEAGFSPEELRGPGRSESLMIARDEAIRRAREAGHSSPKIARAFGGRDHTTILAAERRARQRRGAG